VAGSQSKTKTLQNQTMFAARFAAVTAATLLTGAAIAALTIVNPFQETESQKVKEHDMITKGAGHWAGTITMYLPGVEEPVAAPCKETVTAIGDYWTVSDFKTSFQGAPFHGSSLMGFDVEKGKYVGSWVDSMTTSITNMEGSFDSDRGGIVLDYKVKDMETGAPKNARMVIMNKGETHMSDFYEVAEGVETKVMTIEMTRQQVVEANAKKAAGDAVEKAVDKAADKASDLIEDAEEVLEEVGGKGSDK